jgi:aldehyde dehydrogenase
MYGLGAGVWTRDAHEIYQIPRAIIVVLGKSISLLSQVHLLGYKQSGIGRENHKMMLITVRRKHVDLVR